MKFKISNKQSAISQNINLYRGFKYEIFAHMKFTNTVKAQLLGFRFLSQNKTIGFKESYYSRSFYGFTDWKKVCLITSIVRKQAIEPNPYYFTIYSYPNNQDSEGYVDDISMIRINFHIGINNNRNEVYGNVNVVYKINGHKDDYNISNFELKTRIKDDNKILFEKNIEIPSLLFINSINIQEINLKDNNYYLVECILNNKKDNVTDISLYPFKKIKKIKRRITYDQYGRFFINDELFFPFCMYAVTLLEKELKLINQNHLNIVKSCLEISKKNVDMIYETRHEKINVMIGLNNSFIKNPDLSPKEKKKTIKNI